MPYYMQDLHPDCGAAISLIQHYNTEELKELLNNDEKLDSLVKDLAQVKNAEAEREMLIAGNRSLAEFNLSHEPRLQDSRKQLIESYQQAVELKQQVEEKKKRLDEFSAQNSLDTTLALLQTATAQLEEETEGIAENFLESQLTVELFCEMFLEKRKLMHLRRVKTDKMPDIVEQCRRQKSSMTNMGAHSSPLVVRPAPPPPPRPQDPDLKTLWDWTGQNQYYNRYVQK